jgi:hypothetical protein
MYNRLNKIISKIKSLGSTRWGKKKWLIRSSRRSSSYHSREKRGFKKFTPADVIRRIEEHLLTINESKLS